ncbi:MAG: hypothetical protein MJ174_10965 [Treponema sp.]|nr:hypothetical protein [Treponema sp.]
MDYCRRKARIAFLVITIFFQFCLNANSFYNSLVEDLLNAVSYGYKGINLETGNIDFCNLQGKEGYITVSSETSFYIPSNKGFFMVENSEGKIFYTRNGEFVKRGDDYFLVRNNYKLKTQIIDFENGKKTLIYHPTSSCKIIRDGFLFSFSEVESYEEEIITNRLEIPNIDPIEILLKMKSILNKNPKKYVEQMTLVDKMLDVLINDKMHSYYIERSYLQFDIEKYQLQNNTTTYDHLRFLYSTNWARTFSKYIKLLYI